MPDLSNLTVAVLGNTDPLVFWATEREYICAWESAGAEVLEYHEKQPHDWKSLIADLHLGKPFDLIQWTSTRAFRDGVGEQLQRDMLSVAKQRNIPVVGVHLDQFAVLPQRAKHLHTETYFQGVDLMLTADGGSQDVWEKAGIKHRQLLPAISERWLGLGEPRDEYRSDIAFVGSWEGQYHREFAHRHELIERLERSWGDRVKLWPRRGQPRIVGRDLNDLYASTKVVIGDAFHVPGSGGAPLANTGSDRSPETMGRGGLLLTPEVEGWNAAPGDPFHAGCWTWEMWNWKALDEGIEMMLEIEMMLGLDADMLRPMVIDGIAANHTYTARVHTIVEIMTGEGLWS